MVNLVKAIVYGNVWIAFGATACIWLMQGLGVGKVGGHLLALLFLATYFRYNLIGFTVSADVSSEKFQFAWKYRSWLKVGAVIGGLGSLLCLPWLNLAQLLVLAHLGAISLWYIFPIPTIAPALRKLPYLKIFLIAYVWTCSTWLLPYMGFSHDFGSKIFLLGFAERLLFIFAITLPFDIRDIETDHQTEVKTIPNQWGINRAKYLGLACLVACSVFSCKLYQQPYLMGLLLSYIIAAILLFLSTTKRHDLYFLGGVDGLLVLQAILVWLAGYLMT